MGLLQVMRATDSSEHAAFSHEEKLLLQHICLSLAALVPLLSFQPEQLSFDAPESDVLSFVVDSITVLKSPKSQLYYSNVLLCLAGEA